MKKAFALTAIVALAGSGSAGAYELSVAGKNQAKADAIAQINGSTCQQAEGAVARYNPALLGMIRFMPRSVFVALAMQQGRAQLQAQFPQGANLVTTADLNEVAQAAANKAAFCGYLRG